LEADFPEEMVLEMQGAAAKKARRTVIGRTLGGRASFKALHECLKLHLPPSFVSTTLLTKGYFLILFDKEEGAIATRKLASVEWSGLTLSFSKFSPDFDASAQGSESLSTHSIKVQFLNLHEEFRIEKALTILARKIGEVLDIEPADSYIKRPASPMVTVEVQDISKLAGSIRILKMVEGAGTSNTIVQKIIYSGLLNQCRKCWRFGHHARACTTNMPKPQEVPGKFNPSRRESSGGASGTSSAAQRPGNGPNVRQLKNSPLNPQSRKGGHQREGALIQAPAGPSQTLPDSANQGFPALGSPGQTSRQRNPNRREQRDQEMLDIATLPIKFTPEPPRPKEKLSFDLPHQAEGQITTNEAGANPFASPEVGLSEPGSRGRSQEDFSEG
jgi:hypothetical protein